LTDFIGCPVHITLTGLDTLPENLYLLEECKYIIELFEDAQEEMDTFKFTVVKTSNNDE